MKKCVWGLPCLRVSGPKQLRQSGYKNVGQTVAIVGNLTEKSIYILYILHSANNCAISIQKSWRICIANFRGFIAELQIRSMLSVTG